jgi:hypothetical protein
MRCCAIFVRFFYKHYKGVFVQYIFNTDFLSSMATGIGIFTSIRIERFVPADDSLYASTYSMVPDTIVP